MLELIELDRGHLELNEVAGSLELKAAILGNEEINTPSLQFNYIENGTTAVRNETNILSSFGIIF